jgi:hypothetical protein
MLSVCDAGPGYSRGEFLRIGTLGLGGLSLPHLLGARALAGYLWAHSKGRKQESRSLIREASVASTLSSGVAEVVKVKAIAKFNERRRSHPREDSWHGLQGCRDLFQSEGS